MSRVCVLLCDLVIVAAMTGCDLGSHTDKSDKAPGLSSSKGSRSSVTDLDVPSLASKYRDVKPAEESREGHRVVPPRIRVESLPIAGTWISSGWMGDAAGSVGVLEYKTRENDGPDKVLCDEWKYAPSAGSMGWCAVAYQTPENNWGDQKGKNLSGKGFTRLTFWAKGAKGGERVIFKSGGHTRPNAQLPASYEASAGTVTLGKTWKQYSISLAGLDLSNIPAAFVFVVTKQLDPGGCIFQIRDVAFSGPGE